jgi:hypothetical protein
MTPRLWLYEEIGEAQLPPGLLEEVQDLRLHGNVERRSRLVGHDQGRPQMMARAIATAVAGRPKAGADSAP